MKNSLRYKLLGWFLLFAFLIILFVVPFNWFYRQQQQNLGLIKDGFQQLQVCVYGDLQASGAFLSPGVPDARFYRTGENKFLQRHQKYGYQADSIIRFIQSTDAISKINLSDELTTLQIALDTYRQTVDSIAQITRLKGSGEYGLEGELHAIRKTIEGTPVSTADLLHLQALENNYLLHRRIKDVQQFNAFMNQLVAKYDKPGIPVNLKEISILRDYQATINHLADNDQVLGTGDFMGLQDQLLVQSEMLSSQLQKMSHQTRQSYQSRLMGLNSFYLLFVGTLILLSFVISFLVSKRLSHPLQLLTSYIQQLAQNNFHYPADKAFHRSTREITLIYKEFRNLVTQLYIRENQRDAARKKSGESELKYRELAEMLPQCIFETDHLGNYTFVNKEWYNTFGYNANEIQEGLNLIETLISEKGERVMDDVTLENSDFVAIRKNKSQFPAAVYTNNILKDGKIVGKRGIIIDVTERNKFIRELKKERNKALTSDQLKSYFLANMSHEIRTPMNSIIGFSELLNSPELSDSQKNDFIDHIKSSGELLLNLIDDIIDIAKIEAGEIKIIQRDCNLNKLFIELRDIFNDYKRRENKSELELQLTIPQKEYVVKTDPFRLKQILHNLISNAIKFTHEGNVEFGFHINNHNQLEFTVKDTGIGLTRDKLDFIFQRFKQLESSGKNYRGAGLGLAITKNLVELLGGELKVESEPGVGTTFGFTHPFVLLQEINPAEIPAEIQEVVYDWSNLTFLIAEDNEHNYTFLQEALKTTGASILRASDGEQAVQLALKNPIDLVLMDIMLPAMDGYEATKMIKQKKPKLPVIAQTAHAMANEKEKSIMAGCDDYMSKPIRMNLLLPKIAQFVAVPQKASTSVKAATKSSSDKSN
ncbi:MAG: response regulator [Bacteroidetes bacterium]|jgi:PAS domain S-box-containing protein|nr:response regulator [Bacteroidota bacterium]